LLYTVSFNILETLNHLKYIFTDSFSALQQMLAVYRLRFWDSLLQTWLEPFWARLSSPSGLSFS
jgi:hypothetical protein